VTSEPPDVNIQSSVGAFAFYILRCFQCTCSTCDCNSVCFHKHISNTLKVLIFIFLFFHHFLCHVYYAGESSFEVKIEADGNDITEHTQMPATCVYPGNGMFHFQ